MPVRVLKSVVLPAPLGPISEAIIPSSSLRLTRASACRPPNLLDMSRSSNSDMLQLPVLPRRENPLRPKNHHENQNQTKHHALIFRRFELRRELAQGITAKKRYRQHRARLPQRIEQIGRASCRERVKK